jgi:exonuclease SbcC
MQILSVTLQNFKTHRDRYFEFQPGTNAICGENGAGKTSILEAIAWVLFNYQGDYAKDDLIRNGSGSAQVTVAFTSNYDGRTYQVQRCTQRGYVLFDPQLNERLPYSRIKDEILPWLRQHLGVGPATNLPQLFARTLGVPQGTFTADFLQSAEQRKAVFDAILKVEDYKVAFKQMNTLRRYAEDQVAAAKAQIAQYDEALANWEDLQQRRQSLDSEIQANQQQLQQQQQMLATLQTQRQALKAQAERLQTLEGQRQGLTLQIEAKQQAIGRLQQSLTQSEEAIAVCQANREAYQGYQAAEQTLQTLTQQQQQRQALQHTLQTLQQQYGRQQAELARVQAQLDTMVATEQELAQLQPQILQQEQLEAQQQALKTQLDQYHLQRLQQQAWQQQQQHLTQRHQQVNQSRDRVQALKPAVAEIAGLEAQRDRIQQQLSRLAAGRQFEAEITALVRDSQQQRQAHDASLQAALQDLMALVDSIPLVSAATIAQLEQALKGASDLHQALLTGLEVILQDLADQTDEAALNQTLTTLEQGLKQRYAWQAEVDQLSTLDTQLAELQQQRATLAAQLQELEQALAQQATVEAELNQLNQDIEALGRPREKSQILQRTLHDQAQVRGHHQTLAAALAEVEQQLGALTTQLQAFQDLDQQMAEQQQQRRHHQGGHEQYLRHRQLANQYRQIKAEFDAAQDELEQVQGQLAQVTQTHQQALANFDPGQAEALESQYSTVKSAVDQLGGILPQQRQRLAEYDQQLERLQAIAQQRDQAKHQLQAKEKIKRFVVFARKAYNEAGPRITEQYVRSISHQADRLFRDLLNRPNVALEWTRDYEILVQDGPNQRRFVNLSGGEQMCAALAVRLALLKVLADVDIAFFDEPTTNMDRPRRRGLAEAISRIKTFQQLFVISHDDTFEQVTENVIVVERDAG